MSYLLDALRKAERERNLGRVPELTYAASDTVALAGKRIPVWVLGIVAALVALNLIVLATFWWWGQGSSAPAAQPDVTAPQAAQPAPPVQSKPAPVQARETAAKPVANVETSEPETESSELFDEPSAPPQYEAEIEHFNALAPAQRAQLPVLKISGHLYSSIPGRSFVLVNGRRYHEGQRLPEGPAIMLIDEEGAIFNYRDVRYRLDAPR